MCFFVNLSTCISCNHWWSYDLNAMFDGLGPDEILTKPISRRFIEIIDRWITLWKSQKYQAPIAYSTPGRYFKGYYFLNLYHHSAEGAFLAYFIEGPTLGVQILLHYLGMSLLHDSSEIENTHYTWWCEGCNQQNIVSFHLQC